MIITIQLLPNHKRVSQSCLNSSNFLIEPVHFYVWKGKDDVGNGNDKLADKCKISLIALKEPQN